MSNEHDGTDRADQPERFGDTDGTAADDTAADDTGANDTGANDTDTGAAATDTDTGADDTEPANQPSGASPARPISVDSADTRDASDASDLVGAAIGTEGPAVTSGEAGAAAEGEARLAGGTADGDDADSGDESGDDSENSGDSGDDSVIDGDAGEDSDASDDSDDTDGDDPALVGAGVVAAGSARAAARRSQLARTGVTEKKGRKTAPRNADHEDGVSSFARLRRFFREVVAELRKVLWPNQKQMLTYTTVVIVFVVVMVAMVYGLDALFAQGVLWIFG